MASTRCTCDRADRSGSVLRDLEEQWRRLLRYEKAAYRAGDLRGALLAVHERTAITRLLAQLDPQTIERQRPEEPYVAVWGDDTSKPTTKG